MIKVNLDVVYMGRVFVSVPLKTDQSNMAVFFYSCTNIVNRRVWTSTDAGSLDLKKIDTKCSMVAFSVMRNELCDPISQYT